jgi:hypothetical protein
VTAGRDHQPQVRPPERKFVQNLVRAAENSHFREKFTAAADTAGQGQQGLIALVSESVRQTGLRVPSRRLGLLGFRVKFDDSD